jgi:hypothetical protein
MTQGNVGTLRERHGHRAGGPSASPRPSLVDAVRITTLLAILAILSVLSPLGVQPVLAQEPNALVPRGEQHKYREAAWAHFRKRCKEDAHEAIVRVIENVEAIYLLKPRRRAKEAELVDQYWLGDPYGYSSYEALNPAGAYLYGRTGKTISGRQFTPIKGYRYVEMPNAAYERDSTNKPFLRYHLERVAVQNSVTQRLEKRVEPRADEVSDLLSGYGITWEDISTREDRYYWVAGGKLSVVDLQTGELLAERVGYVIDPLFGSTAQGRRIWLAVGFTREAFCPRFEVQSHRNIEFVAKVLKAKEGSTNAR